MPRSFWIPISVLTAALGIGITWLAYEKGPLFFLMACGSSIIILGIVLVVIEIFSDPRPNNNSRRN
jgi:hypothetical protein